MGRVRQLRALFFGSNTGKAASSVAEAELPVVQAVTVAGAFARTRPFLSIATVSYGIRLSRRTFVGFGKMSGRSQVSGDVLA